MSSKVTADYLELFDWTGRAMHMKKRLYTENDAADPHAPEDRPPA